MTSEYIHIPRGSLHLSMGRYLTGIKQLQTFFCFQNQLPNLIYIRYLAGYNPAAHFQDYFPV